MSKWHDRQSWWTVTIDIIFRPDTWQTASEQVEQMLNLTELQMPLEVLDLPCGVGRNSLAFARLGCEVTAVEFSETYLPEARERASAENLQIKLSKSQIGVSGVSVSP